MAQTVRKFTNGYNPSIESKSEWSETMYKDEKEKVADKVETLLTKLSKVKQLLNKPDDEEAGIRKHILTGNL